MRIVPTILTDKISELKKMLKQVGELCNYVQIDIMDGRFTPSESIKVSELSKLRRRLNMEAHLMVENPIDLLDDLKKIRDIKKIIFHYEIKDSPEEVIKKIRDLRLKVGVAINPQTPVKEIKNILGLVDSVLVLSVNPGFYGSEFIPSVLRKIKEIRRINPKLKIGLDGGIKLNNILEILKYPLDYLCIGSAILKEKNPKSAFLEFKRIM